ncbi:MAG: hypothetical protein IT518_14740 [Burkholderiales bacterium]|nr:hypothetical protein [Burkholderiales bacterium]
MSGFMRGRLSPTFWALVECEFAAENGGTLTLKFEAEFRRLLRTEYDAFVERWAKTRDDSDDGIDRTVAALTEIIVGWRGVPGDDGQPLPFTVEHLRDAVDEGWGPALIQTFIAKNPRAKAKN